MNNITKKTPIKLYFQAIPKKLVLQFWPKVSYGNYRLRFLTKRMLGQVFLLTFLSLSVFGHGITDCASHECGDSVMNDESETNICEELVGVKPLTIESLPAGTLIVPMDNTLQGDFNLRAYGLVVHLLHAEIPLKWIISPGKGKDAIDFSASARLRAPSTGGFAARDFRAGPIAIFPGFETEALAIINSFNGGGDNVNVYELQSATFVNVAQTLSHKPKVAVLDDGGNEDIHEDILTDAGLISGMHYEVTTADNLTANSCFTVAVEPHSEFEDATKVNNVKNFVLNGGNFLAQCAAIRSYADNVPFVYLQLENDDATTSGLNYDNHDEPYAQIHGIIDGGQGGSVPGFELTTNPGNRIAHSTDNGAEYKAYVGRVNGVTTTNGGYVHYLAGHKYDGNDIDRINGRRMVLNAVLRSADRPAMCDLNLGPIAENDDGTIDCGTSSIIIDVLSNDSDPLDGSLTVNNLGTGSQGVFVNNNNGTVTYTPNSGPWSGPDVVTYEACNATSCTQATIIVSSSTPNDLVINGRVFVDDDENGDLGGAEVGPAGIEVDLYRDENNSGTVDGGDTFLETQTTSFGGDFSFTIATPPFTMSSSTLTSSKASSNYEGSNGDDGYGACEDLYIEEDNGDRSYAFIDFDLSSLDAGCTVSSAILTIKKSNYNGGGDDFNFGVRRVTQSWEEGSGGCNGNNSELTWERRMSGVDWSTPGGDFAPTVYDTQSGGDNDPDGTPYTFDVTTLVSEWLSGTQPNHGLAIVPTAFDASGGFDYFAFYSDDAAAANRPQLQITLSCGSGGDYVLNVDTGTLPPGASLTTDNVETASFTNLGQLDCDNDFGFIFCSDPPSAGADGADDFCKEAGGSYDLTALLSGADVGGDWAQTGGSSVDVTDPTRVDFTNVEAGVYTFTYTHEASDSCPEDVATFTITTERCCVDIETFVFIEGATRAMDGTDNFSLPMRTNLNELGVLPGQTYENFFEGDFYNPPGQPYNVAPWNYQGTEGSEYDSGGNLAMADAGYPATAVDWVLVSVRETPNEPAGAPMCQAAALLHSDGSVQLLESFECCTLDEALSYYIVIEHRSHLIMMSHEPIPIVNGRLLYDFREQQSYINDPFGFGSFVGEKEVVVDGVLRYFMFSGNGDQQSTNSSDTDINFDDRIIWELQNGIFGRYRAADYNMSGDINFNDRSIWEENNSRFTSVPRN